jgi:hypothetical protein
MQKLREREREYFSNRKLGMRNSNLDSCTEHFSNPVQNNQQMLKGVVSVFIVLIKLPRHVWAFNVIFRRLHVPRKLLQF